MGRTTVPLLAAPTRTWTFADLQQLPDFDAAGNQVDWRRFEILDGTLVVSPPPASRHELAGARLRSQLSTAVPEDYTVVGSLGIEMAGSYLVPDLMVARTSRLVSGVALLQPADVLLAVEVVSPGSRTMDRVTKPALYAAAGIPGYWRVETDPQPELTAYVLPTGTDTYVELGTWNASHVAEIDRPVTARIDVGTLLPSG